MFDFGLSTYVTFGHSYTFKRCLICSLIKNLCGSKNKHQKQMCLERIEVHVENFLAMLDSYIVG